MMDAMMTASAGDLLEMPYFLTNKDWFYYDDEEKIYKLTDKAPERARKSYEDFYKEDVTDDWIVTLR